ncbi:MAG: response regulator [Bacteroidota bacterium]
MQPRILLVDDREDNLLSIESILEMDGYKIIKANSGKDALKVLLQDTEFALILMDVKMPNLNGFETATLIYEREKLRHIPIIFVTAHSYGDENVFKGYRAGAVDYIYKPINPDLLKAKVSVFIELYKKNHRLIAQEQRLISINRNLENEIKERQMSEDKIKGLNQELLEYIDRLESANKELDMVAFMASHDLQEPLRKILTFSERLHSKYENLFDEEGNKFIGRVQKSAERMQALITDIMTFSRTGTNKEPFIETNLHVLLQEILDEMEGTITEKNAVIKIAHPLPSISANPGLLRPLFFNLISNSLKYGRENVQPVINISFENIMAFMNSRNSAILFCRIFIEDNGIGFDQKYAEQIFGMFKRLHTHDQYAGTGIGLALCKKIVDEHKGFISAKSRSGEGSTFIISLPYNVDSGEMQRSAFVS